MPYKRRTVCCHGHNVESDDSVYQYISNQGHHIRECKQCVTAKNTRRTVQLRANHLLRAFGRTIDQYAEKLKAQDWKCAICRSPNPGGYQNRSFHFDHDRSCCPGKKTCGKCIRDLLCSDCNTTLGLVKDNRQVLLAMIEYLKKHEGPPYGDIDSKDQRHNGVGQAT